MKPIRLLALLTFAFLLLTAFRAGFTHATTDFPNYYTAAVLVRQRQPLRKYYDWTWFQRQMNAAGIEHQLGAYSPQTPLTMIPFVPLAGLPVQRAKQVWLICNLIFLIATVWLLSRLTQFSIEQIWLLAFCGYFSLYSNFFLGQYYIFVLFLLTLSFWLLQRNNAIGSGAAMGAAFALKLYGGPFLLYFAARRRWKAIAGMAIACVALGVLALALFGYADVRYYLMQVLPRSLEGGSIDPYNPGTPTIPTLLRRLFLRDAELNPHPLLELPWLFFFLRTLSGLAIPAVIVIATTMRPSTERRDFAWFAVAAVLLSSNTASYSLILLLLPVTLLLEEAGPVWRVFFLACYVLLMLPLRPAWLFPKLWVLFALFIGAGQNRWRIVPRWVMATAAIVIVLIAAADAHRKMLNYAKEPAQVCELVPLQKGTLFSAYPAITHAGLFYQTMGNDRYVLTWVHDNRAEELVFGGNAFRPLAASPDGPLYFELASGGKSRMMQFDPLTRKATVASRPVTPDDRQDVPSPDGKWLVRVERNGEAKQLLLRDLASGKERVLTGGNCNSFSPAWELDSSAIVFASDCGRALGLPALYRMRLPAR